MESLEKAAWAMSRRAAVRNLTRELDMLAEHVGRMRATNQRGESQTGADARRLATFAFEVGQLTAELAALDSNPPA